MYHKNAFFHDHIWMILFLDFNTYMHLDDGWLWIIWDDIVDMMMNICDYMMCISVRFLNLNITILNIWIQNSWKFAFCVDNKRELWLL
jgi:hypothetical protein